MADRSHAGDGSRGVGECCDETPAAEVAIAHDPNLGDRCGGTTRLRRRRSMASGRERTVGQSRRGADMAAPYRFGCAGAERQVVARCNAWRRCNGVAVRRRSGDADLSLASPASNSGRQHRGADRQPPLDSRPAARRYSIRARRRSRYSATRVGRISRSAPHDWRCERRFSTRRASRGGCAVTRGGHGPDAIRGAGVRRGNGNHGWRGATDDTRASMSRCRATAMSHADSIL